MGIAPSRRGLLLAGAAALALTACGTLPGPGTTPQLYVLHPRLGAIADAPEAKWQLVVAVPEAPENLDSDRIALSQTALTMNYYADCAWTDRAPALIQGLLVEAFEKSGKMPAVGRDTEGLRADYLLQSDLRAFEARYDAPDAAPTVVVHLAVRLVNTEESQIVARLDSEHSVQAVANTVPAAVDAFNEALGAALEEIVGWVLRLPAPGAAAAESKAP